MQPDRDYGDFDHLFTPEVIAKLDAALVEAETEKLVTFEEVNQRLDALREEWLASHRGEGQP